MSEFAKAAKKSEIPEGTAKAVDVNGSAVAVFNTGSEFLACANACPHRGGPLADGDIAGTQVTCPWHGWQFDLKTGAAAHAGVSVQTYPVKTEGDDILVGA